MYVVKETCSKLFWFLFYDILLSNYVSFFAHLVKKVMLLWQGLFFNENSNIFREKCL